jgi:hypothetical protein
MNKLMKSLKSATIFGFLICGVTGCTTTQHVASIGECILDGSPAMALIDTMTLPIVAMVDVATLGTMDYGPRHCSKQKETSAEAEARINRNNNILSASTSAISSAALTAAAPEYSTGRSYSGPSNINSYAAVSGPSTSNVPNVTLTNPVTECISVERGRLPGQYDNPAWSVIVKNNCSYRVLANICFLSADTFGNDCKQVGGIAARFIEANSAMTWPAPDREVNYVKFACPSDYQMSMVWKGSKVDGKCFTCKSEQCSIENL